MRVRTATLIGWVCLLATSGASWAAPSLPRRVTDSRLKAATEWVLGSDQYLHQSQLRRGMTGYGLTVMAGAEIVRFDVEIVSVVVGYSPQRDMILARVSGQGLDTTGIISGMSGSPVYIHHEGKDKMIGALAYGYSQQKSYQAGPLCGIQPISQMLAIARGPLDDKLPAAPPPAAPPPATPASSGAARVSPRWRAAAFAPEKTSFATFGRRPAAASATKTLPGGMRRLTTPIMAGGLSDRALSALAEAMAGMDVAPVRSGAVGSTAADEMVGVKLEPGSSVVVPYVTGDEDLSAVGTITEVIGDKVLGFGHPMFGDGLISYPMATGYIHTVVASRALSFKMGGAGEVVGELVSDEFAAVGGVVGRDVSMIPMTVDVHWVDGDQRMSYEYQILRERSMTPMLAMTVMSDSVWGTRNLPIEHTTEYEVEVDFGPLGVFTSANFSGGRDVYDMISDLTRAISLMTNNPFGVARVESITARVKIRKGTELAMIEGVTLDRNAYAPGETVTATVRMQRWMGPRFQRDIQVTLPENLPDGTYKLTIGDWMTALQDDQDRRPRLYDPKTLAELLAATKRTVAPRMDHLYAILNTPGAAVAVDTDTVAEAPPTVAAMLAAARPLDVTRIAEGVTVERKMKVGLTGQTTASVNVTRHPRRP